MMAAPANVTPEQPDTSNWTPDEIAKWNQEAAQWKALNPGNPDFNPLTVKAGYVIGIIYDICESVSCLLSDSGFARQTSYIPAYGIFASGVEILGRCVKGEPTSHRSTLRAGFKWLADPTPSSTVSKNRKLVTTSQRAYTIEELEHLRNFAAHGQATSQFCNIDYELLSRLQPLLRDGVQHYWSKLKLPGSDELSTNLARANVIGLRDWPVFKCWSLFNRDRQGKHHSVTEIFDRFKGEWKV
jgi:hypothetical protein